jgi:hypothetical protein
MAILGFLGSVSGKTRNYLADHSKRKRIALRPPARAWPRHVQHVNIVLVDESACGKHKMRVIRRLHRPRARREHHRGRNSISRDRASKTRARRMRRASSLRVANPGLQRCRDCKASQVLPAGPMGRTRAFDGWPVTTTPGLRAARTAQRNGFTPARIMLVGSS